MVKKTGVIPLLFPFIFIFLLILIGFFRSCGIIKPIDTPYVNDALVKENKFKETLLYDEKNELNFSIDENSGVRKRMVASVYAKLEGNSRSKLQLEAKLEWMGFKKINNATDIFCKDWELVKLYSEKDGVISLTWRYPSVCEGQ